MAKKRQHFKPNNAKARTTEHTRNQREPVQVLAPKPKVQYGAPFIVLEDEQKSTFTFSAGRWVPHNETIAECRVDCQVKELAQKVNKMTRYEIRRPI